MNALPSPTLLRLPNANAGQDYRYCFDMAALGWPNWQLTALDASAAGLSFDAALSLLSGHAQAAAGEATTYRFDAHLQHTALRTKQTLTVELLVNPDPRKLWKTLEPDPKALFPKPNCRAEDLRGSKLRAVAASVRGRSHAHVGSFREDDFALSLAGGGDWLIAAVADGAGSARYSRRGSELACSAASAAIANAMAKNAALVAEPLKQPDSQWPQLLVSAAKSASQAIEQEATACGASEADFATTLLLTAALPLESGFFVAAYWIGDGALAVFNPKSGSLRVLGEADSGQYAGQTRFLGSSEPSSADPLDSPMQRVSCAFCAPGEVLVLMTDGVSDAKFGTANVLNNPAHWAQWWQTDLAAQVNLSSHNLAQALVSYLEFWSPGEHDDRTLALVFEAAAHE